MGDCKGEAYRVLLNSTNTSVESRDVQFDEMLQSNGATSTKDLVKSDILEYELISDKPTPTEENVVNGCNTSEYGSQIQNEDLL